MEKKNQGLWLIIGVVVLFSVLYFLIPSAPPPPPPPATPEATSLSQFVSTANAQAKTCPDPSQLVSNNNDWSAPGGWKTLDHPLPAKIQAFSSAQWQGYEVGEVICRYQTQDPNDFPIDLQRTVGKTVLSPTGSHWKSAGNAVKSCESSFPADCVFYDIQPPKSSDPYAAVFNKPANAPKIKTP